MRDKKEIEHCIKEIQKRMRDKRINRFCNTNVKEGYIKALEVLSKKINILQNAHLELLNSVQGRAIADLAIDFLNGDCEEDVLLNVPIRGR